MSFFQRVFNNPLSKFPETLFTTIAAVLDNKYRLSVPAPFNGTAMREEVFMDMLLHQYFEEEYNPPFEMHRLDLRKYKKGVPKLTYDMVVETIQETIASTYKSIANRIRKTILDPFDGEPKTLKEIREWAAENKMVWVLIYNIVYTPTSVAAGRQVDFHRISRYGYEITDEVADNATAHVFCTAYNRDDLRWLEDRYKNLLVSLVTVPNTEHRWSWMHWKPKQESPLN